MDALGQMINNLHFTQGVNTRLCNAICTLNPLAPCLIACINLFLINEFFFFGVWLLKVNMKLKLSLFALLIHIPGLTVNETLVNIEANKKH